MAIMRGIDDLAPREWLVSMGAWVIQDGNYGDFAVDQRALFAVGFRDETDLRDREPGYRSARSMGHGRYKVTGEVVSGASDVMLLDFGITAYSISRAIGGQRLSPAVTGSWRSGSISIEVDPFFYYEEVTKREGVPPAVYAWTITGIWRETGPWIPALEPSQPRMLVRDPSRHGHLALSRTDAWSDDDGHGEYLLRCRLEGDPPIYHPHEGRAVSAPVDRRRRRRKHRRPGSVGGSS